MEYAHYYSLFKGNTIYHEIVKVLRDAIAKKRAVQVRCTSFESDTLVEVQDRKL